MLGGIEPNMAMFWWFTLQLMSHLGSGPIYASFFLTVYHIKTYPKNTFTISGWKLNNSKIWATTYVDLGRTYF